MAGKEKKIKSVWEPTVYETVIGTQTYVLRPQPISAVLEFDNLLSEVGGIFEASGNGYVVYDLAQEVAYEERYETATEAQEFIDATEAGKLEVRPAGMTPREILEQITHGPYHIMKPMIPDLELEHVQAAPMGQIEHVIGLLVEVNGMKWFESMVKNFLEPLLPQLIENTAGALSGVFTSSTSNQET